MANYPQLDDQVGVWKLKDVNSAVMGGYWRTVGSRALSMGGNESNTIDFITMASTGNATDFGDMLLGSDGSFETSSGGFFAGGNGQIDVIEFITFATTGDVTDFGNLTDGVNLPAGLSNATRGIVGGGRDPAMSNIINYFTCSTAGNASDFGDLTVARAMIAVISQSNKRYFCRWFCSR